jgi:primary-amine oxidase
MADYKPIPFDDHKDERQNKPTFTISKHRVFFYLSILFNVLSFGFILGKSEGSKAIFSDGMIFGQNLPTAPATTNDESKTSHCAMRIVVAGEIWICNTRGCVGGDALHLALLVGY